MYLFKNLEDNINAIVVSLHDRRGLAVACLGGPLYAIGGLDDNTCYNTVERYDPETDSWSCVQSMNVPRGGVAVSTLKVCHLQNCKSDMNCNSFFVFVSLGLYLCFIQKFINNNLGEIMPYFSLSMLSS